MEERKREWGKRKIKNRVKESTRKGKEEEATAQKRSEKRQMRIKQRQAKANN